jgi:hypothetical protein
MANCAAFAVTPHMLNPSSNPGIILLFMIVPLLWSRYSESFVTRAQRTRRPVRSFDDSIMPVMEAVCSPWWGPAFRACDQRSFATSSKVALSVSVRAPLSVSSATRTLQGPAFVEVAPTLSPVCLVIDVGILRLGSWQSKEPSRRVLTPRPFKTKPRQVAACGLVQRILAKIRRVCQ